MLTVALLYLSIAAVCALVGAALYKDRFMEVFLSNFVLAAVCAWVAGVFFGAAGPLIIAGIPVLACVSSALPLVLCFNSIVAPMTAEEGNTATAQIIDIRPVIAEELPRAA